MGTTEVGKLLAAVCAHSPVNVVGGETHTCIDVDTHAFLMYPNVLLPASNMQNCDNTHPAFT